MSLFSGIAAAEHSFAAWAEKELAKVVGGAPTLINVVDMTLEYAGPILQTVLAATGEGAAATEVGAVISQTMSDLIVIRGVIEDAGPVPSAASMLTSVQSNLAGLLSAAHVTDPVSVNLVNKVIKEVAALLAAFPAAKPAGA